MTSMPVAREFAIPASLLRTTTFYSRRMTQTSASVRRTRPSGILTQRPSRACQHRQAQSGRSGRRPAKREGSVESVTPERGPAAKATTASFARTAPGADATRNEDYPTPNTITARGGMVIRADAGSPCNGPPQASTAGQALAQETQSGGGCCESTATSPAVSARFQMAKSSRSATRNR